MSETKRIVPTVGRIVLSFSERWDGPLPGQIVRVNGDGPDATINVKVAADTLKCTGHDHGFFELYGTPVYESGAEGKRASVTEWCEWMSFQHGQAAMTRAIADKAGIDPEAGYSH